MNIENRGDYYGKVPTGSDDLRTDAVCTAEAPPPLIIRHNGIFSDCGMAMPFEVSTGRATGTPSEPVACC